LLNPGFNLCAAANVVDKINTNRAMYFLFMFYKKRFT
jgi:hypothetical protein